MDTVGARTGWPNHPAAELFPMMSEEDLAALAADIEVNGLREPVVLYDDPVHGTCVLDGRNRVEACERVGVEVDVTWYAGDDPTGFALSLNLNRRHLTTGQRAAIAVEVLPLFEAEAAERRRALAGTRANAGRAEPPEQHEADLPQPEEPKARAPQAADKAAKAVAVSGRAVRQFKRVAEQAPDLAEKVKAGDVALDRAERIVRDRRAEARRIEEARDAAKHSGIKTRVDVRLGDFRDVLSDLSGVDAIITDPPYPKEFIPLLGDLAVWADEVLAEDGVLAVLMGQTYLPEVYRLLEGGRPYRWTACLLTPGQGYQSWTGRVQSHWKPVLLYGGGPRMDDVITSEGSDANAKALHKWGQDYGAFHTLVERLTKPGDVVADPFTGSGTTLLAAKALGRHAVGAELDPESYQTAIERLA